MAECAFPMVNGVVTFFCNERDRKKEKEKASLDAWEGLRGIRKYLLLWGSERHEITRDK